MDAPGAVSPAEEAALADVARELGVEDGESWAALLRELGASGGVTGTALMFRSVVRRGAPMIPGLLLVRREVGARSLPNAHRRS